MIFDGNCGLSCIFWYFFFFLPLYLRDKLKPSPEELGVMIVILIFGSLFGEAIHVELPDEGVHIVMFEVCR